YTPWFSGCQMECLFFSILLEHNTIPGTICPSPVKTGKNGASGRFIKTASLVKKFPAAARFPPEA
ncbi:hypothetical protein, partial [Akkermansia sp.]|uniref:hypothetical protein n=1 Tax=Akkermansia sp. TaxID=1872421 RepID=UPI003FD80021